MGYGPPRHRVRPYGGGGGGYGGGGPRPYHAYRPYPKQDDGEVASVLGLGLLGLLLGVAGALAIAPRAGLLTNTVFLTNLTGLTGLTATNFVFGTTTTTGTSNNNNNNNAIVVTSGDGTTATVTVNTNVTTTGTGTGNNNNNNNNNAIVISTGRGLTSLNLPLHFVFEALASLFRAVQ